jgi:hypothetical protein
VAYFPKDPKLRELRLAVKAEVKRIGDLARPYRYVTYAIRDPRLTDPRGHPDGPRIYVGETKQMWVRADDHMDDGGKATEASAGWKATRIHAILKDHVVPKFELLGHSPTKLASLISETLYARRSAYLGYDLANRWEEHQSREAPDGIRSVPDKRYLDFTVEEALEDGVRAEVRCDVCKFQQDFDLSTLVKRTKKLSTIRKNTPCPTCGTRILRVMAPLVWPKV